MPSASPRARKNDRLSSDTVRSTFFSLTPAGTFKALRVELDSSRQATASLAMRGAEPVRVLHVAWYAPDAKRTVKHVRTTFSATGGKLDEDTYELVRYTLR